MGPGSGRLSDDVCLVAALIDVKIDFQNLFLEIFRTLPHAKDTRLRFGSAFHCVEASPMILWNGFRSWARS